jgi:hypothetical protein
MPRKPGLINLNLSEAELWDIIGTLDIFVSRATDQYSESPARCQKLSDRLAGYISRKRERERDAARKQESSGEEKRETS